MTVPLASTDLIGWAAVIAAMGGVLSTVLGALNHRNTKTPNGVPLGQMVADTHRDMGEVRHLVNDHEAQLTSLIRLSGLYEVFMADHNKLMADLAERGKL